MESYEGQEFKLDLACGDRKQEGFKGVDIADIPGVDVVQNLRQYPWPWADNSVDEIYCSHYIEHIPMEEINGKDALFCFFDECYRILKPGKSLIIFCPNARCNRAFQDPTHRRFIVGETFLYMNKEWRDANKLSHYNVLCDFGIQVDPLIPIELSLLHPEAQHRRMNENWNTIADWKATLIKK